MKMCFKLIFLALYEGDDLPYSLELKTGFKDDYSGKVELEVNSAQNSNVDNHTSVISTKMYKFR